MSSRFADEVVPRSLRRLLATDPGLPERRRRPRQVKTVRRVP
ncbi:hypothetical protein SMC26_03635 [Actinomadura fulvescens]